MKTHSRCPAYLALSAFLSAAFLPVQADTKADTLLDAAKKATGGAAWDKVSTLEEKDEVIAGGLTGGAESWNDLTSLGSAAYYWLGPATGGSGWDGHQSWTTDSSGEVRVETSQEALSQALQDAYRGGYGFFFPGRFPATYENVGMHSAEEKSFPAIKVSPKGTDPFEVWFDPAKHWIVREVQLTGDHPHSFLFSDYRPTGPLLLPYQVIDRIGNDPKFDTVVKVVSLDLAQPEKVGFYGPPQPPHDDSQWPAGKSSVTMPFRLINNHIYVDAAINGKPPMPFVFDTGATNVLNVEALPELGIKVQGALPGGGFGDAIETTSLTKVQSVSLGGFALPNQVFSTTSAARWMAVEGITSGGLLGYEFVKRAVMTVDYANRTMTFTKPPAFHPPAGVTPVSFSFNDHIPMIPATLDGIEGEFELDTGSRGALTVMGPFAKAHGLVAKLHATITGTVGYGVGGPAHALLGRGGKFTIGPVTVNGPVTEITTDSKGAGNETHTAGNIGGDILKRFTVTLDYGKRLAWFQPNALNSEPEVFDRSGLWIARGSDGSIQVGDVTTHSAAAQAGLVIGNSILSVDGKPAKDIVLYELREAFKGKEGTAFHLKVRSKSGIRDVTLKLASQI